MDTFDGSTNWKFHGEKDPVERAGHCRAEFEGLSAGDQTAAKIILHR
jgi:hypothetical protein